MPTAVLTVHVAVMPGVTFGQRYAVDKLTEADAAQQKGFASWLGWDF